MGKTYIRRFRMEFDFAHLQPPAPELPEGYSWLIWRSSLLDRHASVKCDSFRAEIDSQIFPCLADIAGCRRLMAEIANQERFLPEATWLICHRDEMWNRPIDCGTIQGVRQKGCIGAVQNVGVVPEHRGCGLGRALVLKALRGFQMTRLRRVSLEVTAENTPAVELYRSIGFHLARTMYKSVELEAAPVF